MYNLERMCVKKPVFFAMHEVKTYSFCYAVFLGCPFPKGGGHPRICVTSKYLYFDGRVFFEYNPKGFIIFKKLNSFSSQNQKHKNNTP